MKRQRAIRVAHVVDAVERAVPRHDARPRVGVDVEPREKLRRDAFDGVDARVRVPPALHDARAGVLVHLAAHRLDRAGDDVKHTRPAVGGREEEHHRGQHRRGHAQAARQQHRRDHRRDRGQEQRHFPADQLQQQRDGHGAQRGAEEIGEVERAGARAIQIEDHRQRHAAQEERHQRRDEIQRQARQLEGILDQHPEAAGNREAVEQREHRGLLERRRPRFLQQMDGQAAEAPAEQRHRDRDEREVIPDRRRIDARQADFEDKSREGDEEDRAASEHEGTKL